MFDVWRALRCPRSASSLLSMPKGSNAPPPPPSFHSEQLTRRLTHPTQLPTQLSEPRKDHHFSADLATALSKVSQIWLISMPVAACQLLLLTAAEDRQLLEVLPSGADLFASALPLAASGTPSTPFTYPPTHPQSSPSPSHEDSLNSSSSFPECLW